MASQRDKNLFENLFVLELANNHWGDLQRGLKIIREFGAVVRYNGVKAAIKLQFRDIDTFIHQKYRGHQASRYISKTEKTRLSFSEFARMIEEIRKVSCIPMATPFDENSVSLCQEFDLPIIKIASSDINDWPLIEKIAQTRKPVIISTGGATQKDLDDVVIFFTHRDIPLAINHCVSLYPSEDEELNLNQIDYLRGRYPEKVIGFSTHEYSDWTSSMLISYGKGARSWERHIDIDDGGIAVSPYCSLPHQIDTWFKSFRKAVEMCGGSGESRRVVSKRETEYLDELVRGVYARRDLEPGYVFSKDSFNSDLYLAIPLQKGQLSCREIMTGLTLTTAIQSDQPLTINHIDGPYASNEGLKSLIISRGIKWIDNDK